MENANADLRRMVMQYFKNPEEPINPLSMKLNGVVDPRVMGGFANYEKVTNLPHVFFYLSFLRILYIFKL